MTGIELVGVSCTIEGTPGHSVEALRDVSLKIAPGEYVALMGANGSGKSTLARHMNGLLLPTRGSVTVDGLDTRHAHALYEVRQRVGLVFQNPDHQMVAPVVEEEVAFGPENLGLPPEEIRARIDEALHAVEMTSFRHREIGCLSGGQKQRIAIASVLAMQPRYLILDEPTAMLDPRGRADLLGVLRRLHDEAGIGVVLVTHDVDEAAQAGRVVVLASGRIASDTSFADLAGDPERVAQLGLPFPRMAQVLAAFERAGFALPRPLPMDVEQAADAVAAAGGDAHRSPVSASTPAHASVASDSDRSPVVEVQNVSYTYNRGTPFESPALHRVSFTLRGGERVAVIGGTGSGKSTLMQHLNGILRADSGRVVVLGRDVSEPRAELWEVRRHIGLVFQFPEHQLFGETVTADVQYGPSNLGCSPEESAVRAAQALELVGLSPEAYGARSPLALSGGEMRRVALAGVLAMEPDVLVLDEPLAGLDVEGQARLFNALEMLRRRGVAIVVVTHDIESISAMADRIVVLSEGDVVFDGPLERAFQRGSPAAALGTPTCARLAAALAARGLAVDPSVVHPERLAQEVSDLLMKQRQR